MGPLGKHSRENQCQHILYMSLQALKSTLGDIKVGYSKIILFWNFDSFVGICFPVSYVSRTAAHICFCSSLKTVIVLSHSPFSSIFLFVLVAKLVNFALTSFEKKNKNTKQHAVFYSAVPFLVQVVLSNLLSSHDVRCCLFLFGILYFCTSCH